MNPNEQTPIIPESQQQLQEWKHGEDAEMRRAAIATQIFNIAVKLAEKGATDLDSDYPGEIVELEAVDHQGRRLPLVKSNGYRDVRSVGGYDKSIRGISTLQKSRNQDSRLNYRKSLEVIYDEQDKPVEAKIERTIGKGFGRNETNRNVTVDSSGVMKGETTGKTVVKKGKLLKKEEVVPYAKAYDVVSGLGRHDNIAKDLASIRSGLSEAKVKKLEDHETRTS